MAPLLLALLAGVTALLRAGAEGPPLLLSPVGAGGPRLGTPGRQRPPDTGAGLQPGDEDTASGGGWPPGVVRCALCRRVVAALRGAVVDPKDKAGVARVTARVCGRLRAGAQLCRRLLRRALGPIERALSRDQAPTQICTRLRWCSPAP